MLFFAFLSLFAQEETQPIKVGIYGGLSFNMHKGSFNTADGILDCGYFKDATSLRWLIGNSVDFPVAKDFEISGRINYWDAGADFTSMNLNPPNITLPDGSLTRLNTEQNLNTTVDYFQLSILGKYFLFSKMYFTLGPGLGINNRMNYEQTETIKSPAGVTFLGGESTRKIISGRFDEYGRSKILRFYLFAGIGYEQYLSSRFILNPEISYSLPFTNVVSNTEWSIHNVQLTVGIKFALGQDKTIIQEIEKPGKVEIKEEKPIIADVSPIANLSSRNVLVDGTILNYSDIFVSEEISNQLVPLLPYVFFESGSSDLDDRYKKLNSSQISEFKDDNIQDSVLGIYHNLLNIIGYRLNKYTSSTISIVGCNEPLEDTGDLKALSLDRAETLKKYIVDIWKIQPDRIVIKSRSLPQVVSNRSNPDGKQENRRAEIYSDDYKVIEPVKLSLRNINIVPEKILFRPEVLNPEKVKNWSLNVNDIKGNMVWETTGNASPGLAIEWNFNKDKIYDISKSNILNNRLTTTLNLFKENGDRIVAVNEIPVRRQVTSRSLRGDIIKDSVFERYQLIFFDFDKPEISKFNEEVVPLVQNRIRTNSNVEITGYTDRIGEEKYNSNLSIKRANAIEGVIKSRIIPNKLTTHGVGETFIYNNDLPEGRFYNRTVIIDIITPYEY